MRHIKTILMAILSLTVLTSCEKAFEVGSVRFSSEGGTKTIASSSYTLSVHDRKGNYGTGSEDLQAGVINAEMDWLKAELDIKTGTITLRAGKNDTGRRRTLYLDGMYGDIQSTIPVTQDK